MKYTYNEVRRALKEHNYKIETITRYKMKYPRYTVRSAITGEILYNEILMCVLIDRLQIEGVLPYR